MVAHQRVRVVRSAIQKGLDGMKPTTIFTLGVCFSFFVYYLAGGDFQRGTPLAVTAGLSPLVGGLSVLFGEIIAFARDPFE